MDRLQKIKTIGWSLSATMLLIGLVFTVIDENASLYSRIAVTILIQAGGAFFFALTVGWVVERIRDREGYSVLWLFSQEFRKAGVLSFYSDRTGLSEKSLEEAFKRHSGGEVLLVGASLRLFLASGYHYFKPIKEMLKIRGRDDITIRAMSCHPMLNKELPVRSFVEEFSQNASFADKSPFEWARKISFLFSEFEDTFFEKYGLNATENTVRCINDLHATRLGVDDLRKSSAQGNTIALREYTSAPYCTAIIFPDRAFYTPNILSVEIPANLPMIVFHKSSDVYDKLLQYFEFLWWMSDRSP